MKQPLPLRPLWHALLLCGLAGCAVPSTAEDAGEPAPVVEPVVAPAANGAADNGDLKTLARRTYEAAKAKQRAEQARQQQQYIDKGLLKPPPTSEQRRADFARTQENLEKSGEFEWMLRDAQERAETEAGDANAPYYKGRALTLNGDYEGALEAWKQAIALDANLAPKVEARAESARVLWQKWGNQPALKLEQSDTAAQQKRLFEKARKLLMSKDYDAIERDIAALTASKAQTASGIWHLKLYFQGLINSDESEEAGWRENLKRVEAWHAARPKSWLARVTLAAMWVRGAALARGSEFADQVSPAEFGRMEQRLGKMGAVLDEGGDLKAQLQISPLFCRVFQSWALLNGLDSATYDELIGVVNRKFPTWNEVYENAALRRLPRWYGAPGEWESYAQRSADEFGRANGGNAGDILYAQMVLEIAQSTGPTKIWQTSKADWARTKRGLEAMLRAQPDSLTLQTLLFEMARAAQDWPTAQAMVKQLGGRVNRNYYGDNRADFAKARAEVLRR